jgi:DNA-directed RNA polymerase II subunit RPB3
MSKAQKSHAIKIDKMTDHFLSFSISNVDVSIANAIRRTLISDVPSIAIETVEILDNNTVLIDEFLTHRLGQIPLMSTDINKYNFKDECDCLIRCNKCSFELSLNVRNDSEEILEVFSNELVPQSDKLNQIGNIVPVSLSSSENNQGFLIAKLAPGQRINLKAYAVKGRPSEHSKFCCVCPATYDFDEQTNTYHFTIETNGSQKAKDVLLKSISLLQDRLTSILM